jgi:diguanylate cyclase (GGDEF)-like protein
MNTGLFVQLVFGVFFITLIIILILALTRTTKKTKALNSVEILTDELDRHKKERMRLNEELKRINSMDNIFFSSMIRLTSRRKADDIASEIMSLLVDCLDPKGLAIFLADQSNKRISIRAHYGLNDNWLPKIIYELDNDTKIGKAGYCFNKKLPISQHEFAVLGLIEPFPVFDPTICYPIFYQERRFGVIALIRDKNLDEREKNLIGVVSSIAGVALNNTRSIDDITDMAHSDPLTKLKNIGHFKELMLNELERSKRFQHHLSIAIIDLDKFKEYNDTYGHQAGDHLLIKLAQIFSKHFDEQTDTLARYGGDEFIVMCPETNKNEAARILSELLHNLEMYDFTRGSKNKRKDIKVTFSAGVASYPDDAISGVELIKLADAALYDAKGAGRNRVKVYHPKLEKI